MTSQKTNTNKKEKGERVMKMQRRRFRIGCLAKKLNVDKFVIRFWEKEFNLKSKRSDGGQRFYDEKDYEQFKLIKNLLYEKKFTIAGAKQEIKSYGKNTKIIASHKTTIEPTNEEIIKKVTELKNQLIKLKKLL